MASWRPMRWLPTQSSTDPVVFVRLARSCSPCSIAQWYHVYCTMWMAVAMWAQYESLMSSVHRHSMNYVTLDHGMIWSNPFGLVQWWNTSKREKNGLNPIFWIFDKEFDCWILFYVSRFVRICCLQNKPEKIKVSMNALWHTKYNCIFSSILAAKCLILFTNKSNDKIHWQHSFGVFLRKFETFILNCMLYWTFYRKILDRDEMTLRQTFAFKSTPNQISTTKNSGDA